MRLTEEVGNILNNQLNKEFFSSYLYLTFADYYDERGLKGFANWYMIQAEEELAHARILRRYLLDNGWKPKLEAIPQPEMELEDDMAPLKAAFDHECFITDSIHKCYDVAKKADDYRTMHLLDWFVKEQGEEENNAGEMVNNMKLFGGEPRGLYQLDREYLTRVYNAPTELPM